MPQGIGGRGGSAAHTTWMLLLIAFTALASSASAQPKTATRESHFSRAAEAEITFQQGLLHYSSKQLPQAEAEFREVIKSDPNDAEAYYYLGLSQLDQGKSADSLASFDQSLRLDPT